MICNHCVIQWAYKSGNNPGSKYVETFRNCADIEILPSKDIYTIIDTSSNEISSIETATMKLGKPTTEKPTRKKSNLKKKSSKKKTKKKGKKSKKKAKNQPTTTEELSLVMNRSNEY